MDCHVQLRIANSFMQILYMTTMSFSCDQLTGIYYKAIKYIKYMIHIYFV